MMIAVQHMCMSCLLECRVKIIRKVEDVVSEGLTKPVRIQYDNYKLNIRVFDQEIPRKWNGQKNLLQVENGQPIGQKFRTIDLS